MLQIPQRTKFIPFLSFSIHPLRQEIQLHQSFLFFDCVGNTVSWLCWTEQKLLGLPPPRSSPCRMYLSNIDNIRQLLESYRISVSFSFMIYNEYLIDGTFRVFFHFICCFYLTIGWIFQKVILIFLHYLFSLDN